MIAKHPGVKAGAPVAIAPEWLYLRRLEVKERSRGRFDFADKCRQIADALEARGDLDILPCEFPYKGEHS